MVQATPGEQGVLWGSRKQSLALQLCRQGSAAGVKAEAVLPRSGGSHTTNNCPTAHRAVDVPTHSCPQLRLDEDSHTNCHAGTTTQDRCSFPPRQILRKDAAMGTGGQAASLRAPRGAEHLRKQSWEDAGVPPAVSLSPWLSAPACPLCGPGQTSARAQTS